MKTWNPFKKKQKPLSEMGFDEFQDYLADLFKRVDRLCREPVPAMTLLNPGFAASINTDAVSILKNRYKKRIGQ